MRDLIYKALDGYAASDECDEILRVLKDAGYVIVPIKPTDGMLAEIERLRAALNDILLLDGKYLTDLQRWDHAFTLAKRAYEQEPEK